MKKFTGIITKIVTACILLITTMRVHAQNIDLEKWKKGVWIVSIILDATELKQAAVQYAFFKYDPLADFKDRVKGSVWVNKMLMARAQTEDQKKSHRRFGIERSWNEGFSDINGNDVLMIIGNGAYSTSSNAPSSKMWVVTKLAYTKQNSEPICWCIPVQPEIGKEIEIKLNRQTSIDIGKIYDDILTTEVQKATAYPRDTNFKDDPKAHKLYDKMNNVFFKAKSLYYESAFWFGLEGSTPRHANYRIWLKKPNFVKLETSVKNKITGTLIGDGDFFWIYWGDKKVDYDGEALVAPDSGQYMKIAAPLGTHSIAHMLQKLEPNIGLTILQPSRFHSGVCNWDEDLDGVRYGGEEVVNGEKCSVIEASFMKNQRSKYIWVSQTDFLPRKLMEVVRTEMSGIFHELWTSVLINAKMPSALFSWKPPAGWTEYIEPESEVDLLKIGTPAPDFEIKGIDGNIIKISDLKGKVVLLNFWRVGCPPCRWEIPELEKVYRKYKEEGLVVIGFNSCDDRKIILDLLKENSVTYPNIIDVSPEGNRIAHELYEADPSISGVPMNYIIDREGILADAWLGYDRDEKDFLIKKLIPLGFK